MCMSPNNMLFMKVNNFSSDSDQNVVNIKVISYIKIIQDFDQIP